MKNLFKSLLIITVSMFFMTSSAFAMVSSKEDISTEIDKILELNSTDFNSFYNRSEMIGTTKSSFNIVVSEYKLKNKSVLDSLQKITSSIDSIEQSQEVSDTEKESKINDLVQKANEELNKTASNAIDFLNGLGAYMPTITYSKFKRTFVDYYNELYINENQIDM